MYRCHDCGFVFNEPYYETYTEDHGDGVYEPWVVRHCPDCGGLLFRKKGQPMLVCHDKKCGYKRAIETEEGSDA